MPYDKTKPYACPCCGYWNDDMKEDYYRHKEPLLKDYPDEMRAIRAYGYSPLTFFRQADKHYSSFNICTRFICFNGLFENLKDGETYTIDELCGDSEEEE